MDYATRLDLYAIGRDYIIQRAKKIDPAQVDVLGSDINLFVGSMSVVASQIMKQLVYAMSTLLLDSSEDEDLERWAFDRYGLLIKGASAAKGEVTFQRTTTGAGTIPIGTRLKANNGYEYLTTSVANFGANDKISSAYVIASQAGKDAQVGANSIRNFADIGSIFDRYITINNNLPTAGGEPSEDSATFRNRIRDFWRTARRGVIGAIEFGALSVPGVVSAQAIESVTTIGTQAIPARVINLYISDSSGVASRALANDVSIALEDYRAAGVAVLISTSVPQLIDITIKPTFKANIDTVTLTDAIRASVIEYVNTLPVNGSLLIAEVYSVLSRFRDDGLIMDQTTIVSPVADLKPDAGFTLRMMPSNFVVTT